MNWRLTSINVVVSCVYVCGFLYLLFSLNFNWIWHINWKQIIPSAAFDTYVHGYELISDIYQWFMSFAFKNLELPFRMEWSQTEKKHFFYIIIIGSIYEVYITFHFLFILPHCYKSIWFNQQQYYSLFWLNSETWTKWNCNASFKCIFSKLILISIEIYVGTFDKSQRNWFIKWQSSL